MPTSPTADSRPPASARGSRRPRAHSRVGSDSDGLPRPGIACLRGGRRVGRDLDGSGRPGGCSRPPSRFSRSIPGPGDWPRYDCAGLPVTTSWTRDSSAMNFSIRRRSKSRPADLRQPDGEVIDRGVGVERVGDAGHHEVEREIPQRCGPGSASRQPANQDATRGRRRRRRRRCRRNSTGSHRNTPAEARLDRVVAQTGSRCPRPPTDGSLVLGENGVPPSNDVGETVQIEVSARLERLLFQRPTDDELLILVRIVIEATSYHRWGPPERSEPP